ncbi:MAG: peptidase domain-containing ABC transporter [Bacteroidetes bacterium]|nr:peptidase domain-containing ABC transporter [Bacteroidota bacterium]MCA6444543.1 peptidase domain-containing ABC transporter [Bacteroidota bacterium]
MLKFLYYKQPDTMSCGATCLRMVAKHYGKSISLASIVQLSGTTREGANLQGLSQAAEKMGFRTLGVKVPLAKLIDDAPLPCIAHWSQNHFVVIYKIKGNTLYIADPAHGLLTYSKEEFIKSWVSDGADEGILLLLETTPEFYKEDESASKPSPLSGDMRGASFSFLYSYLLKHKKAIVQLIIGLLAGSLLQLIFPFLTQSIIDVGVQNKDIQFIYLILLAQLMVFFGRTTIDIIRNYILMHISSRINISLASDFFVKLMKLPIAYFDTKMTGDIMQRINDNQRIEGFLTGSSLNTLFSLFNFVIFSGVLAWYSLQIFIVFIFGSILYFFWISFFLKRRADLDFKRFQQSGQNASKVMELVNGMQEIKLHNAERQKRWQWESLQAKLFKINLKGLSLTTAQNSGSQLINELKNIVITFLSAKLVLDGQVTLGMMLSISYIIGQLNAPVNEMVNFIQHWQDAKLSLERLGEIHNKEDEEPVNKEKLHEIANDTSIAIKNLAFKYDGVGNVFVLQDLSITIPANKITAIVGSSGSGKTTFMKMLLKFYEPTEGDIKLDEVNLNHISASTWREQCGVVMQEGFIFNDTIANNIAVGVDVVDKEKLKHAVQVANIKEFIDGLPLGYNTKIGMEGIGISTGQKQRILIARAVYKNPNYLFFDEATSALDANNEKVIMQNLNEFFKNKTVVVIAHRLSTVKNADQIIVLENGKIIEQGNHITLTNKRGAYYELVKNQLELGN